MAPRNTRVGGAVLLALLVPTAFAAGEGPDILFLNSYHPGLYWSDQVQEGVRRNLEQHEQMGVEYLDSKRFESPQSDSLLAAEFRFKYSEHPPRLIVASDNYALQFLFTWRDRIFPGIPVVFCGINDFRPDMLERRKGYTGISEHNEMSRTIDLWLRIRPNATDLWLVTERSATGTGNRIRLDSLAKTYAGRIRFHFFDSGAGITWPGLLEAVSRLGPNDLVYWSELYRDRDGLFLDPGQVFPELIRRSGAPVAAHSEHLVVAGASGGVCNRGLLHGLQVGRVMRRVLDGTDPDSIPISIDSSIGTVFRWEQLDRYSVDPSSLPASTVFLGRPVPVWKAYPIQTAAAAVGIAILAAMAVGLGIALGRARRSRTLLERSESALRQSEDSLRKMFDTIKDAVIVHDTEGTIVSMNLGGCRMYGITPEECRLYGILDLSGNPDLTLSQLREIWLKVSSGQDMVFEWRARRPRSGEYFDVEVALTSIKLSGEPHLLAVVRDVSERVETRRLLEHAKEILEQKVQERTIELSQSNQELEAFSYSVSHDLRAPLRAIEGFARVIEEDIGDSLPAEQRDFLVRIRAAGMRMGRIIDDLLRLSRLSRTAIARTPVDMLALVEDVLAETVPPERQEQVRLHALPRAMADGSLLKLLWTNLLSNAMKYSARQEAPVIEIGAEPGAEGLVWFVRDNGVGFDPAEAGKLFKPFSRLHDQKDYAGTGVGLAIVQRIVAKHGGRIWAESRPGEGATFRFTLG